MAPLRGDEIPCSLSCVAENVSSLVSTRQIVGDHPSLHVKPQGTNCIAGYPSGIRSLPAQTHQPQLQEVTEQQRENDMHLRLQQLREATTFHGAAIGQTGTSTRQELTAWIRVLAIPCRGIYATDSASMMNKALRLIAAAERDLDEETKGINIKRGNPFGRPWGLQTDGDLWQQAWLAVKSRSIGN